MIAVPAYQSNGSRRIAGWAIFALKATLYGLRQPKLDIVYASSPHLLAGLAGLVIAKLRRKPFILEIRDIWPESLIEFGFLNRNSATHKILLRLERALYRSADHIVVVAEGWRAYFADLGVDETRLTTITNGADPSDFKARPDTVSIAAVLGVEGPVAVYAGAHGPPNGLDYVLDAAHECPDVTFALFGDGASKQALIARAKREGLTNVRFLDPVPKAELSTFLWTADIGIHTLADMPLFKLGMSPNKLYDYMAAGLPVVTNAGGLAESILSESSAGVATDPDGVAKGIREILGRSPSERERMGRAGRDWVSENASRGAMADRLADLLSAVSSRRKGAAL